MKLQGLLTADEADEVESILIFFDNFVPFFEMKMGNEVYCSSEQSNKVLEN